MILSANERAGQGLDLLEMQGWDDAALGVIKVYDIRRQGLLTAAMFLLQFGQRRPRQRSTARIDARTSESKSTGFSPKPLRMIFHGHRRSPTGTFEEIGGARRSGGAVEQPQVRDAGLENLHLRSKRAPASAGR